MVESNPAYKYNNSANRITSKEEEREDPRRGTSNLSLSTVFPHIIQHSTHNPVIPCKGNYSTHRINSSTRILQKILQLQGSSHACLVSTSTSILQQLFPMHPSILHGSIRLLSPYSTPRLPVNSTEQKQHSKQQAASKHSLQQFPGRLHLVLQEFTWYFYRFKYYMSL